MKIAQQLYEGIDMGPAGVEGLITYMRTDSTNVSAVALTEASEYINDKYGSGYALEKPRIFSKKVQGAQEAHEAIRPSGSIFKHPDELKRKINDLEFKLYKLIWKRTIASQMKSAKLENTTMHISDNEHVFETKGKIIKFHGFLKAYVEGKDYKENDSDDKENVLPDNKFRGRSKPVLDDYLHLSQSTSASLTYDIL